MEVPVSGTVMNITSARKAFGGNEVLKDISLEVKRGEVVAIIEIGRASCRERV